MSENGEHIDELAAQPQATETDFYRWLTLLLRWKRFVLIFIGCTTFLAAVVSFVVPKWYLATASILPPKQESALSAMGLAGSLLKGVGGGGGTLSKLTNATGATGPYNYLAILKSRTVMEAVVNHFDLRRIYGVGDTSMEAALKELQGNTSYEVQEDDYITVNVLDKVPARAAEMANYFVSMLNQRSIELGTLEAKNNREFIEKRVDRIYGDLSASEEALKNYQEKSGILIAPEEASSGVSAIAELYGMKAKKEIELGVLERTVSKDNPVLLHTRTELSEIDKKVDQIPQAGMETLRLYRQVAIQQKILEFVLPMFEQAKIDEQKTVPVLLVLDIAVPPEHKDSPKRLLIIFSAFLSSLIISVLLVMIHDRYERFRATHPDQYREFVRLLKLRNLSR